MPILSREKGNRFEREVCETLGAFWGCEFRRAPLSGGWDKRLAPGDLIAVNPEVAFPFSVECKAQEAWSLDDLLFAPTKGDLARFLKQASSDALGAGLAPLLVAKRNRKPPLLFLPEEIVHHLIALLAPIPSSNPAASFWTECGKFHCIKLECLQTTDAVGDVHRLPVASKIRAWAKARKADSLASPA